MRKKVGWDELEREAKIKRTERQSFTTTDAERLERKILGPYWGRRRAKKK